MKKEVAMLLPEAARTLFYDIVDYRVLGASKHIDMICDIFSEIARAAKTDADTARARAAICRTGEYLAETRGQASQAVRNAVAILLRGLDAVEASDANSFSVSAEKAIRDFRSELIHNAERILQYAKAEMEGFRKFLFFDYSSTVRKFLVSLAENADGIEAYIPESRAINGGRAYAQAAVDAKLKTHFFPDAAMLFYLKRCDAALIGAETFNPDGTAFNTIGSDILGELCTTHGVPCYVLTPLMKVDRETMTGRRKKPVFANLENVYAGLIGEDIARHVDFECPELAPVDAKHIKAYITEKGVIPAFSLYQLFA